LNNLLFKNIPHVGSFWHFVICCICVFVYLCNCISIFIFVRSARGNLNFHILEPSSIQKYTTCWVFLALYFAFAHLTHGNIIFDTLEQSFFKNILHVESFWHFIICCICVFVYSYLCICTFDTWEYHF